VLSELQQEDDDERCVRKLRYALRLVYGVMGDKSCHLGLLLKNLTKV